MTSALVLTHFNTAAVEDVTPTLLACCDVPRWAEAVIHARPYDDRRVLLEVADAAARTFTDADVERALAAHPRIGERAKGHGPDAVWSRGEQAGVAADRTTADALAEANRAYEQRFGRVFLICASGRSAEAILTAARTRLANDAVTESRVVADELRQIALLRLRKVIDS